MYTVETESHYFKKIINWEVWAIDDSFIQFNKEGKDNFIIIPKSKIKYIYKT